ncbi:MAG: retroviral-like aspartic protease family protein [Candidatus Eiseniibacteriota bacterium]
MPVLIAAALSIGAATAAHAHPGPDGHAMMMRMPPLKSHLASDTVSVPMNLVDGRIVLAATINGQGPFPFVFDTGASGSVMDLAFAREQGIALGGEVMVGSPGGGGRPGHIATIDSVGIGGLSITGLTCVAFEGLPFKGANPPRGVIGPYGLAGLLVTLDYPHQRLVFTRGALPEPDQREIFGWTESQPLPRIPVTVAGQQLDVHLDSGAMHGLSLSTAYAKTLPLASALVAAGHARTVDQDVPAQRATVQGTFTIGRYSLSNPTVYFSDVHQEIGNLGPVLLRQFALTIDPANRRLKLAGPASGKLVDVEPPAK